VRESPSHLHGELPFARGVYGGQLLAECLESVGYSALADRTDNIARDVQKLRWQTRLRTGFDPIRFMIPKRFLDVTTWRGKINGDFLRSLKDAYAVAILKISEHEKTQG